MRKKTLLLLIAGFVVLALFAPAAMASDYPQNGQFIAYYDEDKLAKVTSSPDGGTTNYNEEAASSLTRTTTRALTDDDWPQFMHDVKNTGYSACDNIPSDNSTVNSTGGVGLANDLGIEIIGSINPVGFKSGDHTKIFVMTGYAGFDEPPGTTEVNLTCLDWYNNQLSVEWNCALPRTTISSGYYSGSWSSAATDGTYAYASSDNKTVKVRISDGVEMWRFSMFNDNCNGGPTVTDDYVFCSDWKNYYCLNKTDGTMLWNFNETDIGVDESMDYAQATPAYEKVGDNEYIYVTSYSWSPTSGYVYKVNVTAGGTEEGSYEITGDIFAGSVSIDGGYVYVASYNFGGDGDLYKIFKGTGTTRPFGWSVASTVIKTTDATPSIDSSAGHVYVSGGCAGFATPRVGCYSTANLNPVWIRDNEGIGGWTCSVAIGASDGSDKLVFAGTETSNGIRPNYCYIKTNALKTSTNTTKWFYDKGGATAAIIHDEVFTVDHEGDLIIFS